MKHRWDHDATKTMPACDAPDGNARTERTCRSCGMVKITVHPAEGWPWHKWRTKEGYEWQGEATPPCLASLNPKPEAVSETTAKVIAV